MGLEVPGLGGQWLPGLVANLASGRDRLLVLRIWGDRHLIVGVGQVGGLGDERDGGRVDVGEGVYGLRVVRGIGAVEVLVGLLLVAMVGVGVGVVHGRG